MKRLALVLLLPVSLSACVPVAGPNPVAFGSPNANSGSYSCSIDGNVSISWTSTTLTLSTPFGRETLTGTYPTYFGNEISATVAAGTTNVTLSAPGERQTCVQTGAG